MPCSIQNDADGELTVDTAFVEARELQQVPYLISKLIVMLPKLSHSPDKGLRCYDY